MPVRYPELREELIHVLGHLSDVEHQQRVWVRREYPSPGYFDDLLMNVHFLLDDTTLDDQPAAAIGDLLENEQEVRAVTTVIEALRRALDDAAPDASDADVIAGEHWPSVVAAARGALSVLASNA